MLQIAASQKVGDKGLTSQFVNRFKDIYEDLEAAQAEAALQQFIIFQPQLVDEILLAARVAFESKAT